MAAPRQVSDGNFAIAYVNGCPEINYPFADEGDNISWEWKPKLRMDAQLYTSNAATLASYTYGGVIYNIFYFNALGNPALLSQWQTPLGAGVLIDPGEPTDVGCGLYEWTPTISGGGGSLSPFPVNRLVGQTMNATFQARGGYAILYSYNRTVTAQVLHEYSLSPFPELLAPTILTNVYAEIVVVGDWNIYEFAINGASPATSAGPIFGPNVTITATPINPISAAGWTWPTGAIVLGQDSKNGVYKGGLYQRESWFITYPNLITLQGG